MSLEQLWGLGRLLSELTCGNCRGRSGSLSEIMQIVTSAVRVKQLCEVRTPESLQGPRYLGLRMWFLLRLLLLMLQQQQQRGLAAE